MAIERCFNIDPQTARRLINETKHMTNDKSGESNFYQTKTYLFDEYAVLRMQNMLYRNVSTSDADLKHLENIAMTLLDLQATGINVVPILAYQCDNGTGYMVQPRAKGAELYDREKMNDPTYVLSRVAMLAAAPQVHYDRFVADIIAIVDAGILIDFMGKDNFFYDASCGFQFIDLNAHDDHVYGLTDMKPQGKQVAAFGGFLPCYYDIASHYRDTVTSLLASLTAAQRTALIQNNKAIFEQCKSALVHNGVEQQAINDMLSHERFIPQKQVLGLV